MNLAVGQRVVESMGIAGQRQSTPDHGEHNGRVLVGVTDTAVHACPSESSQDDADATESIAAALLTGRPMLLNLAYRLLGSVADAEDAVQETFLRWYMLSCQQRGEIRSPQAWLARVITRICLDNLRSARYHRERYVGPWLPEPVPGHDRLVDSGLAADPADCITLDESVTMAILVILETMTPAQRVAFVLHDLFAFRYEEVADILGRSTAACRTLAYAARQRIQSARRNAADHSQHAEVVDRFKAAFLSGDISALIPLMDSDMDVQCDGVGEVSAALRPILGPEKSARYFAGIRRLAAGMQIDTEDVNGWPGLVVRDGTGPVWVAALDIRDDKVRNVWVMRNPKKLGLWR